MKSPQEHKKIGQFISKLRQRRSMSQGELAKALGTSQSAVARMEKGEQNFSTEMLSRISQALGRSILRLTGSTVSFKVTGGRKLSGTITTNTAKNAAMSILAASLLNKGRTKLENMPKIEEVFRMIEVLESIGVHIKWSGTTLELTPPAKVNLKKINTDSAKRMRSIIMLIGPLMHEFKSFSLPHAGGCQLGKRTIRPHLYALENLGVRIKTTDDDYNVTVGPIKKDTTIVMSEAGDTAAENIIMAAARVPGKTTIKMVSANYMVQDLCHFLVKLGIKIEGIGTSTLVVHGKKDIKKSITYSIMEDPIEAMLFLSLAATTNSAITIKRAPIDFIELELLVMEKMGFKYAITKRYKGLNGKTNLVDIKTKQHQGLTAPEDSIHPRPYPGINADNLPFFVPIAALAKGRTLIHDWMYDKRAIYYTNLNTLNAQVELADPHRVYVTGPSKLKGTEVMSPPALRPAAIMLVGMLAAKGDSILRNVYMISRGYEDLVTRLQKIGAKIEILQDL